VLCDSYGLQPLYTLSITEDGSSALMAACSVLGRYVSLPYTYLSGFLATSSAAQAALENHLVAGGYRIRYRKLGEFNDNARRVTSIVTIDSLDDYWKSLSHNTRNQFRKSETQSFEYCEDGLLDEFYDLMSRNMHRLGTPVHARRFYENLHARIAGTRIFTVKRGREVVAAMCGVIANEALEHREPAFYVLWACTHPEYARLYVNYFLYWQTFRIMNQKGIRVFDLGYSNPSSGVFQFKQKLRPVNLGVYDRTVGQHQRVSSQDGSSLGNLAAKTWTALPYSIASRLGPLVRKYIV